jgi:hypothetical protein
MVSVADGKPLPKGESSSAVPGKDRVVAGASGSANRRVGQTQDLDLGKAGTSSHELDLLKAPILTKSDGLSGEAILVASSQPSQPRTQPTPSPTNPQTQGSPTVLSQLAQPNQLSTNFINQALSSLSTPSHPVHIAPSNLNLNIQPSNLVTTSQGATNQTSLSSIQATGPAREQGIDDVEMQIAPILTQQNQNPPASAWTNGPPPTLTLAQFLEPPEGRGHSPDSTPAMPSSGSAGLPPSEHTATSTSDFGSVLANNAGVARRRRQPIRSVTKS